MTANKILFVDDEEHLRNSVRQSFDLADMQIECFERAEDVLSHIDQGFAGILISDIRMPGMDGLALLQKVHEIDPDLPVILVTGHADVQLAVEAMRVGAYDLIEKPFATAKLLEVARRALEKRSLTLQVRKLRAALPGEDDLDRVLAGRSKLMEKLRNQIRTISQANTDVLLVGETGTGKDVAARAIHSHSDRASRPFVSINCGALPAEQIESELFGHEVGAFPGAIRSRYGKFEHAHKGTIFLDEIESMPMVIQIKLLQVLQDRSITRLGSNEPITLDVRFLAASKVDLQKQVDAGSFRADLFYRLNAIALALPSLAARREDVPILFSQFIHDAALRHNRNLPPIAPRVLVELAARQWPGNVRELKNAAERHVLGLALFEADAVSSGEPMVESAGTLPERMARLEAREIASVLRTHHGNLRKTYETLGISRKSLYEKMQKFELSRDDFTK